MSMKYQSSVLPRIRQLSLLQLSQSYCHLPFVHPQYGTKVDKYWLDQVQQNIFFLNRKAEQFLSFGAPPTLNLIVTHLYCRVQLLPSSPLFPHFVIIWLQNLFSICFICLCFESSSSWFWQLFLSRETWNFPLSFKLLCLLKIHH